MFLRMFSRMIPRCTWRLGFRVPGSRCTTRSEVAPSSTTVVVVSTPVVTTLILSSTSIDFILDFFNHFIWDPQILDTGATNIDFWHPPESVSISRRADDFSKTDIHPVVA